MIEKLNDDIFDHQTDNKNCLNKIDRLTEGK